MSSYSPAYKPNQLILGEGAIAVITGWTQRKTVAQHLPADQYAVIGNLYSPTRGISPLIRNLSLNPHVRWIVGLSATKEDTNSGSVECLHDFFCSGVREGRSPTGRPVWIINSPIVGYIDIEIPRDRLDLIRAAVGFRFAQSMDEVKGAIADIGATPMPSPWGEPQAYPQQEIIPTVLPGRRYGHCIEGETIAETWVKILHRIKTTGTIRPTGYDGSWQELIDLVAVVTDEPESFHFPEPNYLPIDREFLEGYIPQILDDAPYQEGVKYSYGQRLRSWFGRDQVEQVVAKLSGEIDAASAVMNLWDAKDHEAGGSPCLNHIWVRVVDGELSLTATFRSNDMFSAWPANAMGLRALQRHIMDRVTEVAGVALRLGPLITISQSAHIYEDTWESVDRLIEQQYSAIARRRTYSDPVGNFLIETQGSLITVSQSTPGSGEVVNHYQGRKPELLIRQICAQCPAIQPDHIGYLGIELERAHAAILTNKPYTQDSRHD